MLAALLAVLSAFAAGYLIVQLELQRRQILWTNGELLGTQQLLAHSSRFSERLRIPRYLQDVGGYHLVSLCLNLEVAERKANAEAVPVLEEEVLPGHTVLLPALTHTALGRLKSFKPSFESASLPDPLTPRETEKPRLIASGFANKKIADLLGASEGTIQTHASTILSKLDVSDRTRAVSKALDMGII